EVVRWLALFALSDYLQHGAFDREVNTRIQSRIGRSIPSEGWLELLRETVRAFLNQQQSPALPGLATLLFDRGDACRPSTFLTGLDDLAAWRARLVHPTAAAGLESALDAQERLFH